MTYQSLHSLKKAAITALNSYCDARWPFKTTHYKLATALKEEVNACKNQAQLLELLYKNYENLLTKRSKKLAKALALVLAEAWDLNQTRVQTYHDHLTSVKLIPYQDFERYWNIDLGKPKYLADPLSDARKIDDNAQASISLELQHMTCVKQECNGNGRRIEHDDHVSVSLSKTYCRNRDVLYVIYEVKIPNPIKQEYKRRILDSGYKNDVECKYDDNGRAIKPLYDQARITI